MSPNPAPIMDKAKAEARKMTKKEWRLVVEVCHDHLRLIRRYLITKAPLAAGASLRLAVRFSYRVDTMATDGRYLLINPNFLMALSTEEGGFVYAHEALHPALGHLWRRGNRDPHLWNVAADYVDNAMLVAAGLTPPKGVLYDPQYVGMTTEEVYAKLAKDQENGYSQPRKRDGDPTPDHEQWEKGESLWPNEEPEEEPEDEEGEGPGGDGEDEQDEEQEGQGGQGDSDEEDDEDGEEDYDGQGESGDDEDDEDADDDEDDEDYDGQEDPEDDVEKNPWEHEEEDDGIGEPLAGDDLESAWRQTFRQAEEEARMSGGIDGKLEKALGAADPVMNWKVILAEYMGRAAGSNRRTDWTKARKYRMPGGGRYFMPKSKREGVKVGAIVDVSGSVGPESRKQFIAELVKLTYQTGPNAKLHIALSNHGLIRPTYPHVRTEADLPIDEIAGYSGGTCFQQAFSYFDTVQGEDRPTLLIVLTDGEVWIDYKPPKDMDVLWLITIPGDYNKPWGKTIKMDPHRS